VSNLLTSFNAAANSLATYEKAMGVVQNDTVNVNTPGYVRQSVSFESLPFDVNGAQAGGVSVGNVQSSRDEYAEYNVQLQQTAAGMSSTLSSHLSQLQGTFDLQSTTGVAGSLNTLFSAFSQLTVSPNDTQSRQSVISAASGLATAFNVASHGLDTAIQTSDSDIQSTVKNINDTIADIQSLNVELRRQQSDPDPSLDARLHVDLENLSQYTGINVARQSDGSVNISINGQRPLLIGTTQYSISAVDNGSSTSILDSNGNDITNVASTGQLGALVKLRNTIIPGYQSQLNLLAKNVADTINTQLQSGVDKNGNPGTALFQYSAAAPAGSLAVTSITTAQVAAANAANPGGNDNAMALSTMQNNAISSLGNFTMTEYYGNLSSTVGRDISNAKSTDTTQQQLVAQAQSLRSQSSSVSLDEEAARLVEYQKAYEATSKLLSVIDNMTETLLSIVPTT
jgi:flagellar hook-associated protein 1